MDRLRRGFRGVDRLPAPDLWNSIETRKPTVEFRARRSFNPVATAIGLVLAIMIVGAAIWVFGTRDGASERPGGGASREPDVWGSGTLAFQAGEGGDIYLARVDAGSASRHELLVSRHASAGTASLSFEWSPNGEAFAFTDYRNGNLVLYVAGADGSSPRLLSEELDDADSPTWSPDGTRIAFSGYRAGTSDI